MPGPRNMHAIKNISYFIMQTKFKLHANTYTIFFSRLSTVKEFSYDDYKHNEFDSSKRKIEINKILLDKGYPKNIINTQITNY